MSNYPALSAMGINNPKQIAKYAMYMTENTDILRIVYDREKGSFLAETRKYRFPRLKKSVLVDGGTRQTGVIFESSAEFRNAVSELDRLMDKRDSDESVKHLIAEEVKSLEEDVAARINYIKSLVDKV